MSRDWLYLQKEKHYFIYNVQKPLESIFIGFQKRILKEGTKQLSQLTLMEYKVEKGNELTE
ncbi:hypothetical protein NUSPORA_01251 [Nucleospora cyclopteri]